MKKTFKTVLSFVTISIMILSLASCNFIKAIMEGIEPDPIQNTPAESEVVSEFNSMLENSMSEANEITESISYSAGRPEIYTADGERAGTLDKAANQLKTFIMSANPGKESSYLKVSEETKKDAKEEIELKPVEDTLLKPLNADYIINFTFNRDITTENVTDENDKEVTSIVQVTDEVGKTIEQYINETTTYESNNALHMTFNYFESKLASEVETEAPTADETTEAEETTLEAAETVAEETTADEETTVEETATDAETEETTEAEEETEPETVYVYADDEVIIDVFGSDKNKEDVLVNFENISDYIVVKDYSLEYGQCKITSDADLFAKTLSFVNFEKNMKVTVKAEGVGELAAYGEIEIVFNLTKSVSYSFAYPEEDITDNTAATTEAETKETTAEGTTEEAYVSESVSA